MTSAVQMDDLIPKNIDLDLGMNQVSHGREKGMVWDEDLGVFRLMGKETARAKVMLARPSQARYWALRVLAAIGILAICAMAVITVIWLANLSQQQPAAPLPVAAQSVALAPTPKTSPSEPAKAVQAAAAPQATSKQPPAAPPAPVKPTPAIKAVEAPKQAPPVAAKQPSKPEAQAKPQPVEQAEVKAPAKTATSVPAPSKLIPPMAVRVEKNGVIFFDGRTPSLVRVGDPLPNGERLIDVDEGSSTYATDRGIRQIRANTQQ